jgi:hypothetical protein
MLRKFLVQCTVLALPILGGILLYGWWNKTYLPAPRLTPNIAVNEKVDRIVRLQREGADVLSLGSSMTLNNLASGPVLAHFKGLRYVNAGAWGMGAGELIQFGPMLVERLKPSIVLVAMSPLDMIKGSRLSPRDSAAIVRHLDSARPMMGYLWHREAAYYLRQMELNRIRFDDPGNYEYLGYDASGAALLQVDPERREQGRYAEVPPSYDKLKQERYEAFARFANYLAERDIRMIVLSSPFREGLTNEAVNALFAQHHARLHGILDPLGHTLLEAGDRTWPDALYADASHFNADGAQRFTAHCLAQLRD